MKSIKVALPVQFAQRPLLFSSMAQDKEDLYENAAMRAEVGNKYLHMSLR